MSDDAKDKPKRKTAEKTPLKPGQHSIGRVHPFEYRGGWAIRWTIRTPDGRLHDKKNTGKTKTEARERAQAEAKRMLETPGNGKWSVTDPVERYLDEEVKPLLEKDRLADSTTRRYLLAYDRILGTCSSVGCEHKHSLSGLSIADATIPEAMADCLEEIARLHGAKTAKHAKTILSRYFCGTLKKKRLIQYNPLADVETDFSEAPAPKVARGGQALTLEEYQRVYAYLMGADPEDVEKPRRGRWSRETRVTERAMCIDLVLLQMATGLRTSEAALRSREDFLVGKDGVVRVHLTKADVKNRKAKTVTVIHPDVAARIAERVKATPKGAPVFPSPSDPTKPWDPRNRDRKLEALYLELWQRCEVPLLEVERGHVWRATLNTRLLAAIPEAIRLQMLGHTATVNRARYTDGVDPEVALAAGELLRPVGTDGTDVGTDSGSDTEENEGESGK